MAGGRSGRDLNATPTWAVALVSAVIILISIILEKVLHGIGQTFERKRKKALVDALEKIKGELMVLGFISLLLTFGQNYIAQICIPDHVANTMLPCPLPPALRHGNNAPPMVEGEHPPAVEGKGPPEVEGEHSPTGKGEAPPATPKVEGGDHPPGNPSKIEGEPPPGVAAEPHRRLLYYEHRFLAADAKAKSCQKGHVPVISINGLHQLHIFIFFLAVLHVVFGAITMNLGRLKIRGWKEWEHAAAQDDDLSNDPTRFRLTHETSFVRGNTSFLAKTPIMFYPICFYRQFFRSVRKADYLTMRHGFISVHLAPGSKFDFQKYIKRSLEDDFKVVVGISPPLWASAVIFLLLNVHGWQIMLWLSLLPLVTILAVGTKLQAIITQMAVEITERHAVVQGIPLVQVSDRHFWFGKPDFILHLLHLTLFQNAFEITYFVWITYEYGLHSCFHEDLTVSVLRFVIGLVAQVVCSYITLPLYALVTQMGSNIKKSVFDDQTNKALSKWTMTAKKKRPMKISAPKVRKMGDGGGSPGGSGGSSPRQSVEARVEMTGISSGNAAANITASIDIPDETHPHHNPAAAPNNNPSSNSRNVQFPDLLTGP
ncbi:OLC1v1016033C1 [Oldenlandia corymbosa var. corymbosa]|uniref:MLO-like protein n=1 Tax=Oldenlandia corymbosa var. corymbosa TaxID=529605 RepID=A0AAV1E4T3_OLDCO|nr:OLC1v1016033C1 [Oldenlandia corymbosa var. corymbosa]